MRKFLTAILFILSACSWIACQHQIEGKIVDESKVGLTGATTLLLDAADSTMISFALTNEAGKFRLEDVGEGNYLLQVSYVGHTNMNKPINIKQEDVRTIDIGELVMMTSSEVLNEVTVTAEHIPIGLRGDTISYNADAFKTRPGANVEDLLKKLPGIEVDRGGNIKAQGEDVQNVLVDGKEFFGNDPKIATKNLEAVAVDEVEVFDKKSEVAEFTGVDDGAEEKTINLKLKDEHKAGGFGNVTLKGGTEDNWLGKLNYNRFNTKMQASIIAAGNNINEQAFSFNEYIGFMGGFGNAIAAGGMSGFDFGFGGGGSNGRSQEGVTKNISLGTNFNYDFTDKLQLFSNYFYIDTREDLQRQLSAQNFTPQGEYGSLDSTMSRRINGVHRLNTKLKFKPNPFTQIIMKNNLQGIFSDDDIFAATQYNVQQTLTSRNTRNTDQYQDQFGIESNVQWRQKFKKEGRSFINQLTYKQAITNEENSVVNDFLLGSSPGVLSQFQTYKNKQKEIIIQSNYTEPVGKQMYLGLSYRYQKTWDEPIKDFFDRVQDERIFNEDLSSLFEKSYDIHRGGFSFKRNRKKLKLNAFIDAQHTQLLGNINNGERRIENDFFHWLPGASLNYRFSSSNSFGLNYSTRVTPPTLSQLMPLPDNSNPNIFVIGNPDLIPEYNHFIRGNYNFFDQFNFVNLFANVQVNIAENKIINRIDIAEDFTRVIQPINTNNYQSIAGHLSFSSPIRPIYINTRLAVNYQYAEYTSFVNAVQNGVKEDNWNFSFKVDNRKKEVLDIAAGVRVNLTSRKYSVNADFNQNFVNYDWFAELDVFITKTTTFSTSFDHTRYSSEFFSDERSFNLWNASISQKIFKERLTVSVEAWDLLKQNIGFNRFGTANSLQQSEFNTLTRYVMLGLSYKLSKAKAPSMGIEIGE